MDLVELKEYLNEKFQRSEAIPFLMDLVELKELPGMAVDRIGGGF